MKLKVYSIYDTKAKFYGNPFNQTNEAVAIRTCKQLATDPNHQISRTPEDYQLFEVGEFDDQTGIITPNELPQGILNLNTLTFSED